MIRKMFFMLLIVLALGAAAYYMSSNGMDKPSTPPTTESASSTQALLDQLVAEGLISPEQAADAAARAEALPAEQAAALDEALLQQTAEKLGMRWEDLKQQVDVGRTIQDMAAERGIDLNLIRDTFSGDITRSLNEFNNLVEGLWGEIQSVL